MKTCPVIVVCFGLQPAKQNDPAIAASAIRVFSFIIPRLPAYAATNKKGVTFSRSATGTGMPSWNAFRHARPGLSSALSMISKLPVLLRTAAEATQIVLFVF
jgi:hypothetical protein